MTAEVACYRRLNLRWFKKRPEIVRVIGRARRSPASADSRRIVI